MKLNVLKILQSWEREDDADDYFEMWADALRITPEKINKIGVENQLNYEIFSILNYNMLTEMQKIKDLFNLCKNCKDIFRSNFSKISEELELLRYDFLHLLTQKINDDYNEISDSNKKKLFIAIIQTLLNNYVLLTQYIFDSVVFKNIGDEVEGNDNIKLYRTWRRSDQLQLMKSQNKFEEIVGSVLITDNYLSASLEKELALQFYSNSSGGVREFILWEIEIPKTYPYLKVSDHLKEILIHIGAVLEYQGYREESFEDDKSRIFNYKIEQYKWIGFNSDKTQEVIKKYKKIIRAFNIYM